MLNIIYFKKEAQGGSILVKGLTEDGKLLKYKFPGILKSKRRNSLFLVPATVWDFTLTGNLKEFMVPKEFSLNLAPFDAAPSYKELLLLGDLLKPLSKLKSVNSNEGLFQKLYGILQIWKDSPLNRKHFLLNRFYLSFLDSLGLLNYSETCVQCAEKVDISAPYLLTEGSLCSKCSGLVPSYSELTLPGHWLHAHIHPFEEYTIEEQSPSYRLKILNFIDIS